MMMSCRTLPCCITVALVASTITCFPVVVDIRRHVEYLQLICTFFFISCDNEQLEGRAGFLLLTQMQDSPSFLLSAIQVHFERCCVIQFDTGDRTVDEMGHR